MLAGLAGMGLTAAQILRWQNKLEKENPELYKQLGQVNTAIGAADPSKNLEEKKEEIKEALSPEAFERMDALTSTRAQLAMIKAAEIMMNELTKEGFERSVKFWSKSFPIYLHYRMYQLLNRDLRIISDDYALQQLPPPAS